MPVVPGYHGERQEPEFLRGEGRRDRLSGADQGGGRRRRQGHAPRRERGRVRGRARERAARGAERLRRSARAGREIRARAAPHRDPGLRRRARQRRASLRARLLAAAPAPEGDRGGAGARHDAGDARRDGQGRGRGGAGGRLCRRRHGRVHRRRPRGPAARPLLVHGDEHAAAGRASGHRGDHRARPRRAAVPRRRRRDAAVRARTIWRSTATPSRRGSMPRTRRRASCRRPASSGRLQFPAGRGDPRRHRGRRGRCGDAVLRSDDRQGDRPWRDAATRRSTGSRRRSATTLVAGPKTNLGFLRALCGRAGVPRRPLRYRLHRPRTSRRSARSSSPSTRRRRGSAR